MSDSGERRPPNEQNPYAPPALSANDTLSPTATSKWLVGCSIFAAVTGAIVAAIRTKAWEVHDAKDVTSAINNATYGAIVGIGIVLLCRVIVWREIRTMPPGYWFGLNGLPTVIALLVAMPWDALATFEVYKPLFLNVQQGLRLLLFVTFALTTRAGGLWRAYASCRVVFAATVLLRSAINLANPDNSDQFLLGASIIVLGGGSVIQLAVQLLLLAAIGMDVRGRENRNGIHWACIGLCIVNDMANFTRFLLLKFQI